MNPWPVPNLKGAEWGSVPTFKFLHPTPPALLHFKKVPVPRPSRSLNKSASTHTFLFLRMTEPVASPYNFSSIKLDYNPLWADLCPAILGELTIHDLIYLPNDMNQINCSTSQVFINFIVVEFLFVLSMGNVSLVGSPLKTRYQYCILIWPHY